MIENLLESVFEKINRKKVKYGNILFIFQTVQKLTEVVGYALNTRSHIMFVF